VSRRSVRPTCSEKDLAILKRWASGDSPDTRLTFRAEIVIKCIEGLHDTDIAELFSINNKTPAKWRNRFIAKGPDGLFDDPRPGQPIKYRQDMILDALEELLEKPPPPGKEFWDADSLSSAMGIAKNRVWDFLRAKGIRLERRRRHRSELDPLHSFSVADVTGLFADGPDNALVLSLHGPHGVRPVAKWDPGNQVGRPVGRNVRPPRRRTLLEDLETARSPRGRSSPAARGSDRLLAFLERLIRRSSESLEHHVIVEGCSVTGARIKWLATQPRVTLHVAAELVPEPGTWLGAVEAATSVLIKRGLKATGFKSGTDMFEAIEVYFATRPSPDVPMVWMWR
jgi:transposase